MKTFGSAFTVFCVLMICSVVVAAESPDFDYYRSIITRQMFGAVPAGFDPANPSGKKDLPQGLKPDELAREQSKLASTVQMHTFMHTPEGVLKVGFSDNAEKPPKNYLLKEGEERDGWLVSSVVDSEQAAVIEKNGIAIKISMSGKPVPAEASGRQKHDSSVAKAEIARAGESNNAIRSNGFRHHNISGRFKEKLAERRMLAAEREEKRKAEEAAREAERSAMRESLQMVAEEIKQMREAEAMRRDEEEELRRSKEAGETPVQDHDGENPPQDNVQEQAGNAIFARRPLRRIA